MKLAKALLERGDLQKRIQQLEMRLMQNARVQEGQSPAEDPVALMEELDRIILRLEQLVTRINITNATVIHDGQTLTALLAKREMLSKKVRILRDFLSSASNVIMRGTKNEIAVKSTVSVSDMQKDVDELSKSLRELDMQIQELNWLTDLA